MGQSVLKGYIVESSEAQQLVYDCTKLSPQNTAPREEMVSVVEQLTNHVALSGSKFQFEAALLSSTI